MTSKLFIAPVMVALLGSATIVSAQMELASINGTVRDEAGQPLEGVVVKLKDVARGREFETKTDKGGRFVRRGLQAVDYEFTVEKPGYNPIKDSLKLAAGLEKRYDFKLVKAAPEGAAEFAKGVAAFNSGDNASAAKAFEETLAKAPNLPEVRINLALAYLRLGRAPDAVAQLEKARELAPDKPSVLFQLGEAYVEMKDFDKAIASIQQGLAKQPDLKDPVALDGTVTLGAVYFARGDNDSAIAQFQKAATANPRLPAPHIGLGKAYFSKGDVNRALAEFRTVVSSSPGTPEATEAQAFIQELEKTAPKQ
jgi:tetratricopeptide (TPR) repeat protein